MNRTYIAAAGDRLIAEDPSYMVTRFAALLHARKTKEPVELRGDDRSEIITPRMATDEEITVVRDTANKESAGRTINAVGAIAAVGRTH